MARTTIMTVSPRDFASRAAVLAVSALAHVLVYGALSLAPASTPPARTRLIVTELIVTEPAPPPAPVQVRPPVTPPRPLVRPKPLAKPAEIPAPAKPAEPPKPAEPTIERETSAPPIEAAPRIDAAQPLAAPAETPREVATAPPPDSTPSSSGSAMPSSSNPLSTTTASSAAATRTGSAAIVAALPAPAVASAATRTAIPRGGYQVTPSYPASARRLGIEGTALLRVFVDATGHVGDIVVKQSAGHPDLDRAATDAVRRWRFDPARRGVDAVAMWVELPVEFHLR
jgi:periplasmic protein TonB